MPVTRAHKQPHTSPPHDPVVTEALGHPSDDDDSVPVESSDDEYIGKGKKAADKHVRKCTKTVASNTKTAKSRNAKLSILPTLPLDVLFEILSHLTPTDLLNIARTSKAFRQLLLDSKAVAIWKEARQRHFPDAPERPKHLTEASWANLVFAGTNCQSCGTRGVTRVDFGLYRRTCVKCMKKRLVWSGKFKKLFPDMDRTLLVLLPYTNVGGWAHGHKSSGQYYWDEDIRSLAQTIAQYEKDIGNRKKGAKTALKEFKASRLELVAHIQERRLEYEDWMETAAKERQSSKLDRRSARWDAIRSKFRELGYIQQDIIVIRFHTDVIPDRELTERIWSRIRPILEPIVAGKQQERLAYERSEVVKGREQFVERIYLDFKRTLVPIRTTELPHVADVLKMAEFDALIHAEGTHRIDEMLCQPALKVLPGFIADRADRLCQELLGIISSDGVDTSVPDTDRLTLAKSVFRCANPECVLDPVLFGLHGTLTHQCFTGSLHWISSDQFSPRYYMPLKIGHNERGQTAVVSLTALLGMNSTEVQIKDLDDLDKRFVCLKCPYVMRSDGRRGRLAMTWRQCVSHFTTTNTDLNHATPEWWMLDEKVEQPAKDSEKSPKSFGKVQWSCNHCTEYLQRWEGRHVVIAHVKNIHNVEQPKEGHDFFHAVPCRRFEPLGCTVIDPTTSLPSKPRQPEGPNNYRCMLCAEPTCTYILDDIHRHVAETHRVLWPASHCDIIQELDV